MTVNTIIRVKDLIDEIEAEGGHIVSVWKYIHAMSDITLFAVFTEACNCDIFESPYVLRPKLIYRSGHFIGEYKFMNKVS